MAIADHTDEPTRRTREETADLARRLCPELAEIGRPRDSSREPTSPRLAGPDDPDDPARLVPRLERTADGCRWLLDRWLDLRRVVDAGQAWPADQMVRTIRLLGQQPLDAADDPRVLAIVVACFALDRARPDPFAALWDGLSAREIQFYRERLLGRRLREAMPATPADARSVLLDIVNQAIRRLEQLELALRARQSALAALRPSALLFDDSPEGRWVRSQQDRYDRALARIVDRFTTARRTRPADGRRPDAKAGATRPARHDVRESARGCGAGSPAPIPSRRDVIARARRQRGRRWRTRTVPPHRPPGGRQPSPKCHDPNRARPASRRRMSPEQIRHTALRFRQLFQWLGLLLLVTVLRPTVGHSSVHDRRATTGLIHAAAHLEVTVGWLACLSDPQSLAGLANPAVDPRNRQNEPISRATLPTPTTPGPGVWRSSRRSRGPPGPEMARKASERGSSQPPLRGVSSRVRPDRGPAGAAEIGSSRAHEGRQTGPGRGPRLTGAAWLLIILTPVRVQAGPPSATTEGPGGPALSQAGDPIEVGALRFLGRAKKFLNELGTEPTGRAEYFNVLCALGHRVRGERTEGYQALRCPACGEGVFVLPRSPLPEPAPPPGMAPRRARSSRPRGAGGDEGTVELTDPTDASLEVEGSAAGLADDQIIWDEEPESDGPGSAAPGRTRVSPEDLASAEIDDARRKEAATGRPPGSAAARGEGRSAAARRAASSPAGRRAAGAGQGGAPSAPAARPRPGTAGQTGSTRPDRPRGTSAGSPVPDPIEFRPKRKNGPRVGLIFFLLGLLVVSAVGWCAWQFRRDQLPQVVKRGVEEGIPALDSGEFELANQLLSAARDAVNALGGAVQDADEIRQAADEAEIFASLCPDKLEDLLAEAGRPDNQTWASKFNTLYKGRSCLFDTTVESTPAEGGYEIAYVILPPGEASRFGGGGLALPDRYARVDLEGFQLFEEGRPVRDAHVTFGAKIESLNYDTTKKHWVVRLEPKSGRFIRHHKALEASGLPAPDSAEIPTEAAP